MEGLNIILINPEYQINKNKGVITMIEKTFKDLYDFIKTAEVDYFGYHQVTNDFGFHIYSMKNQVNVCDIDKNHPNDSWISRMNIVYDTSEFRESFPGKSSKISGEDNESVKVFIADSKHHIDYGNPIIEVGINCEISNTPIPLALKNVIFEALK